MNGGLAGGGGEFPVGLDDGGIILLGAHCSRDAVKAPPEAILAVDSGAAVLQGLTVLDAPAAGAVSPPNSRANAEAAGIVRLGQQFEFPGLEIFLGVGAGELSRRGFQFWWPRL